jgi:hypothetical protein
VFHPNRVLLAFLFASVSKFRAYYCGFEGARDTPFTSFDDETNHQQQAHNKTELVTLFYLSTVDSISKYIQVLYLKVYTSIEPFKKRYKQQFKYFCQCMLCVAIHQYYSRGNNNNNIPTNNSSNTEERRESIISMPGVFENALNASKVAGKKAKIRAELALLDRKIPARKRIFGIELYDELSAMTCSQDFYSTTEETISIVRPHLLGTDREIRALSNKALQAKGDLDIAVARRAEAFPVKATNWKEKAANAATATTMRGNETKFKTRMVLVNKQMNSIKEKFGIEIYPLLEERFSVTGTQQLPVHSPTDKDVNTIRFIFQKCKTDIEEVERTKKQKREQVESMDVDMSLRRL